MSNHAVAEGSHLARPRCMIVLVRAEVHNITGLSVRQRGSSTCEGRP